MKKEIKKYIFSLLLCFLFYPSYATVIIPKGFEELSQGQIVWLDVSIYGKSLGLFRAKVDLENVIFLDVSALAEEIKNKYNSSPDLHNLLLRKLNSPLARNTMLACSATGAATGCDYINTQSIALIYDEKNAKASLFLDKKYLPEKKSDNSFYKATEESHNALIHQQNINFVTQREYQSAAVQGNGTLGISRDSYINVDWNWQAQRYRSSGYQKADISNAFFRQDLWKRIYLQAGVMDSRDIFSNAGGNINLSQLPINRIQGVRTGSTMAWIDRSKALSGTPVTVFLSQDSRVDAYRGEQLLSSFYLKAGAQELNTKTFPPGSYALTLRIYENNQLVRTQTTPYTAIGASSVNTVQWFLQSGKLVSNDQNDVSDNSRVLQGGVRIPVTNNLALTTGATLLSDVTYGEAALDWTHAFNASPVDGIMTSRFSSMYGSDGSRGNIQQINYSDGFSLSFYSTQMTAPDCGISDRRFSYSGCYKSNSTMLAWPAGQWFISLGYGQSQNYGRYVTRRQLPVNDPKHTEGVPWEQIWTTRSQSQVWQTGLSRTFSANGLNISTSLNAFVRDDTGYQGRDTGGVLSISFSRQATETGNYAMLGSTYQTSQQQKDNVSYNASYSYAKDKAGDGVGASLYGINTQRVTASAWGRGDSQYGSGSLNFSDAYDRVRKEHVLSSTGNYNSSFLLDSSSFTLGRWGDGTPSAAISIGVSSPDNDVDSAVNISLDTGGRADVSGNSKALFVVPGYQQTTFNVRESFNKQAGTGSEIRNGAGSRTVFMTPGQVYTRNTDVNSRYTWLGKMRDEQGKPLQDWIPLNVSSWTPLAGGGFTMETERKINTLYVMRQNEFLTCRLKVKAVKDVVRYVGETNCTTTSLINLPEAEIKQVKLMSGRQTDPSDKLSRNQNQ